jgi:hypothetical protein
MTTRSSEQPGLFAWGYRDASGNPYVAVMWVAGTFAPSIPAVDVRLTPTDPDMTIEGAGPNPQVGTGSGVFFAIGSKSQRKVNSNGFVVLVNGELKQGDRLLQSFRADATVPRNLGPISCDSVFTAGKRYELMVSSNKNKALNQRMGEIVTYDREPAEQQEMVTYKGRVSLDMTTSVTAVHLELTGSTVTIKQDNESESGIMTGQCSGQGVSVSVLPANPKWGPVAELQLQWRIRPLQ